MLRSSRSAYSESQCKSDWSLATQRICTRSVLSLSQNNIFLIFFLFFPVFFPIEFRDFYPVLFCIVGNAIAIISLKFICKKNTQYRRCFARCFETAVLPMRTQVALWDPTTPTASSNLPGRQRAGGSCGPGCDLPHRPPESIFLVRLLWFLFTKSNSPLWVNTWCWYSTVVLSSNRMIGFVPSFGLNLFCQWFHYFFPQGISLECRWPISGFFWIAGFVFRDYWNTLTLVISLCDF